ncbi:MAG: NnrS family protein [Candidatus Omnitrophica bacterium]|nr:NnrS family protein [Candidatus Omnitrophota bacterium]
MKEPILRGPVLLQTGFRIFFLGAAVQAVVSVLFWYFFYVAGGNIFVAMPLTVWHGHEMVFGFSMAVVAGFLLTAVMNWTGQPTLHGFSLLLLFLFWLGARVLAFMPASFSLYPCITFNLLFMSYLAIAVMRPIIAVKQWKQSAVFSKLILILISAMFLYWALMHEELIIQRKALRFAVYMLISLIFTIGRRVIPFFVERGVGYPVHLRNSRFIDLSSLIFLVLFSIFDIFWPQPVVIISLCVLLTIVHVLRLAGWYTLGIWKKNLLWVLFSGYLFLISGFLLKIWTIIRQQPDDAALHAWTTGGIGIFTLGMMARVAWGHTGRNIAQPPRLVTVMFFSIIISACVRVFFPLINESHYIMWVAISQLLWVFAFCLYLFLYFSVLISSRPDGKFG